MAAIATQAASLMLVGSLMVAPGFLLVAVLADAIPVRLRVLAAFVLSPGVLSLELLVAIALGLDFKHFVFLAGALDALAAIGVALYWRPSLSVRGTGYPTLLACALVAPIIFTVLSETFRTDYNWHNMMQVAAIQQINLLPRIPEEFEMAGLRLNYGWLGWTQLAAISKLLGISPTRLFLPINVLHFIGMFVFVTEGTVLILGHRQSIVTTVASVAVALLAVGLPDIVIGIFKGGYHAVGEARITPMMEKIQNMDTMVFGLSSFAVMVFAVLSYLEFKRLSFLILAILSSLASCSVYPLFLPSCLAVAGTLVAYEVVQWIRGVGAPHHQALIKMGLAVLLWGACFSIVIWYGIFLGRDSEVPPFSLIKARDFPLQFARWGWIYCSIDAVLLFIVAFRRKYSSPSVLFSIFVTFGLQMAYVVIAVRDGVEYKFLFTALLFAAPVVAAAISRWAHGGSRSWVVAGVLTALFLSCVIYEFPRWTSPDLRYAVPLDIYDPDIAPDSKEMPVWLRMVRDKTPRNAVLFTAPDERPIAVFSGRALYVCGDVSIPVSRAGYSMNCTRELTSVKGYSPKMAAERMRFLGQVLDKDIGDAEAQGLMKAFRPLARPMVFHTSGFSGFTRWLKDKNIGRPILVSDTDVVWLVDESGAGVDPVNSSAFHRGGPT